MATKPREGEVWCKGLSGRATKKRAYFFAASLITRVKSSQFISLPVVLLFPGFIFTYIIYSTAFSCAFTEIFHFFTIFFAFFFKFPFCSQKLLFVLIFLKKNVPFYTNKYLVFPKKF